MTALLFGGEPTSTYSLGGGRKFCVMPVACHLQEESPVFPVPYHSGGVRCSG